MFAKTSSFTINSINSGLKQNQTAQDVVKKIFPVIVGLIGVSPIAIRFNIEDVNDVPFIMKIAQKKLSPLITNSITRIARKDPVNTIIIKLSDELNNLFIVQDDKITPKESYRFLELFFETFGRVAGEPLFEDVELSVLLNQEIEIPEKDLRMSLGNVMVDEFYTNVQNISENSTQARNLVNTIGKIIIKVKNSWDLIYTEKFMIPILIITASIVFVYAFLAAWFRNEIEIRSKYLTFLVHLFISGFFIASTNFTHGFSSFLPNLTSAIFIAVGDMAHLSFFSALNCRLWLMYFLFVKQRKGNYFLPFLWHIPFILTSGTISVFYYTRSLPIHNVQRMLIPTNVISILFMFESLILIILTRKSWNLFCDFGLNLRMYTAFIISLVLTSSFCLTKYKSAIDTAHSSTSLIIFYYSFTLTAYLLDSFTLVFVKIFTRIYGFSGLSDFEFVAQLDFNENDIYTILNDKELGPLFLDYSRTQLCEENVLFLKYFYDNIIRENNENNSEESPIALDFVDEELEDLVPL
eukprot:Pgem_evm1s736